MVRVVKIKDVKKDAEKLELGAEIIKRGGLVAFPTETVYGLGCDALNEKAVRRLYKVKGRPANKPLILHIHKLSQAYKVAELNDEAKILMKKFFPGPIALVLKKKSVVPDITSGGTDKIAVRMPANSVALKLIELSGKILAAPSANRTGSISPTVAEDVMDEFGDEIDLIIDGGETDVGIESTVVDLTTKPAKILRPGAISVEEIKRLGVDVVVNSKVSGCYRMNSKIVLADQFTISEVLNAIGDRDISVGICAFEDVVNKIAENIKLTEKIKIIRVRDLEDYSKKLFRAMREFKDCEVAIFQSVEEAGIGRAIMARLRAMEQLQIK